MEKRQWEKELCAAETFLPDREITKLCEYGNGHINTTYLVEAVYAQQKEQYILQKINTEIFTNVKQLMENITNVTAFLAEKIEKQGGNPKRETLQVVKTVDGRSYYEDSAGNCYRMYVFITNAVSYDEVRRPEDFFESAIALGKFQKMLADYPAETLHETIPDFHHTPKRFKTFCRVVEADVCGRAAAVQAEIAFVLERGEQMSYLTDLLEANELPLRVTHNDTKLNNVMIDEQSGKAICMIDLDTVMPGLSLYDFGDSIRFGANTAAEDEPDASKAGLDMELYEVYVKGYLSVCRESLTEKEIQLLPWGAKMMTLECGMRFLTDYLQGDTYFKIHREGQNLDRCRTQFALVADMERKWEEMNAVVRKEW